jgi:hypothetical protein
MTGLIIEGIQKGACADRVLDLYGVELDIPGTDRKEEGYIFVSRVN